jgi:hypothetical protein
MCENDVQSNEDIGHMTVVYSKIKKTAVVTECDDVPSSETVDNLTLERGYSHLYFKVKCKYD